MQAHSRFFKVLADDARLQMLWLLLNHEELCVCDFVAVLEITQSKASRHLRTLFHAGVVTDRKDGLWSYYSLQAHGSDLTRPHLELLRTTLAACPEAPGLLDRLTVWLKHDRSFPDQPTACVEPRSRRDSDRKASGHAQQDLMKKERR